MITFHYHKIFNVAVKIGNDMIQGWWDTTKKYPKNKISSLSVTSKIYRKKVLLKSAIKKESKFYNNFDNVKLNE